MRRRYATDVTVLGDTHVSSYAGNAIGLYAFGEYAANVTTGGGVTVYGADTAIGVKVHTYGDGTIKIGGDVNVSGYFDAKGVYVYAPFGQGNVYSGVGGNVSAYSFSGNASGMLTFGYGNVTTHVGGDLAVTAPDGVAVGVDTAWRFERAVHHFGFRRR